MADEEDVADIMEEENVVVVDDGSSRGLPATMVVTSDDGMMVTRAEDSTEPSLEQQQRVVEEEEEVGGILEQAIASHNLVEYVQPSVDNNSTTAKNVISVVGPSGDIVNTVVDTDVLSHNNNATENNTHQPVVTSDPDISDDNSNSNTNSNTVSLGTNVVSRNNNTVVNNVVSNVLSIPRVVHIEQTAQLQQQDLPTVSTQQQHRIGHATVVMVTADQGSQRVGDQGPSPSPVVAQPITIETHRYVDGAGNFTVVAPPNSSIAQQHQQQQQNSLSQAIVTSSNCIISGGDVADDNTGAVHQVLSRQTLVGQHAGLTTTHVLATSSPVVTATITNNSNCDDTTPTNISEDEENNDSNSNEMVVHPQLPITLHEQQNEEEDDDLDQEMDPDEIAAQSVDQQMVNNSNTNSEGIVENGQIDNEEGVDSEMDTDHVQSSNANGISSGSISITLAPTNDESGAPLGSSQNPIRIIQQGNQYTPLQQLTTDQLQQIMQVVQQQQLARNTQAEGSSILYNPQTNTRIVYRVIYPSELHKSAGSGANDEDESGGDGISQPLVETQSQGQQTISFSQLPRRPYRRRNKDDDEKIDGPDLTKEEKEERKKHRPRTRSGRVSKPPKHMVKDYKHIHVLDWDEDYDDSDGGYSDFKYSDNEDEASRRAAAAAQGHLEEINEPYIHPGLGSSKPKNFKCETCSKAYIGRAGLARHYRLNPDHGQLSAEDELELRNQVLQQSAAANGLNSGNISEDSNTQDSILGLSSVPKSTTVTQQPDCNSEAPITTLNNNINNNNVSPAPSSVTTVSTTTSTSTPSNNINHVIRGRKLSQLHETPAKRKARLKDLIKQCEDEELMEIVLPRLATVITVWEFLLMKVEKGRPSRPHMADVFKEFEMLHKQVQKRCQKYLSLLPEGENHVEGNSTNRLQIQNPSIAQALGLNIGTYEVKEIPVNEDNNTFQYKLLTTEPSTLSGTPCQTAKRTVELVTQEQLVSQPLSKRIRLVSLNTNDLADLNQFPANSIVSVPVPTSQQQQQQQQQSHTRSIVDSTNNQPQLPSALSQIPPQPQRTPLTETHNIRPVVESSSNNGCATSISTKSNSSKVALNNASNTTPIRTIVHLTNNMGTRNGGTVVQLTGTVGANGSLSSVTAATAAVTTTTTTTTTKTTTAPLVNGVTNATNGTTVMLPITVVSTAPPSSQQSSAELVPPLPPPPTHPPQPPPQPQPQTPRTVLPHVATTTTMTLPKLTNSAEILVANAQPAESPDPSLPPSGTDSVDMINATSPLHQQRETPIVSLPVSVTQSPPSPTQTSVVAADPMTAEPSSPLTQLAQIQHSSSSSQIELQSEMDSVPAEAPTTTTASAVGVEHTVMEVPLSMEPSQPITVAVTNNTNVLDLGHLNSEDSEMKSRVLGSIDQGQIIFQDSVPGQIVTPEQLLSHSNIFQTADGIIIIQKSDGTTMQFQGEQSISLETVQALLAMDTDCQLEQVTPVQQQQQTPADMGEQQ